MADTIERLYKITVDGTAAVRQLEKISSATSTMVKQLNAFGNVVKAVGAAMAVAFVAREIVDGILRTSDAMDQLGKDAQAVGIAVEDLQKLRYGADLAGVSAESLDKAVASLASGMADLATGTSDTAQALRAMGVKSGDSPTAALEKIADRFAKMPDGIAKTATAIALFGKKIGPDLIPWLNGGSAEIKKMGDQLEKFGGVLTGNAIKAAEDFNDNLSRLGRRASILGGQFTTGILPALQGIIKTMTEAGTAGDGFRKAGALVGEALVVMAKGAVYTSQIIRTLISDLTFLARIKMAPTSLVASFKEWRAELKRIDDETKATIDKLTKNVADAQAAMAAPPTGDPAAEAEKARKALKLLEDQKLAAARATEKQRQAEKDAKDAADELRKAYESLRNETAEHVNVQGMYAEAMKVSNEQLDKATVGENAVGRARNEATKAIQDQLDAQDQANQLMQAYILLAQTGTEEQKRLAGEWLATSIAIKKVAPVLDDTSEEMKAVERGFEGFVDALSSGTVSVSQAFEGMAKSIIASLLKILAQKYIIEKFSKFIGATAAQGLVFEAGEVVPFARGGVISRPLMLPMALMGEAGPEAVMPLKRGADGNLGVAGGATGDINVTVNNNAPGVEVSSRRTGPSDLEIIVQRTKDAIAADVRAGGGAVARSFESAYGLGRGAAAPF